jgi:hypothetical protein
MEGCFNRLNMVDQNTTIGRTFFKSNNTSESSIDLVHPKISSSRNLIGYQSGLFGTEAGVPEKSLYERHHRMSDRPRMIVEQVAAPKTNAILLPGMDQEKIFRPLWVTVPQKDLPVKSRVSINAETLRSFTDVNKLYSVFVTWFRLFDEKLIRQLSEQISKIKIMMNDIIPVPSLGLQPALFDAAPIASMDKARYIASRESFTNGRGVIRSSAWKYPTLKFVVTVPKKAVRTGQKTVNPSASSGQHIGQWERNTPTYQMQVNQSPFLQTTIVKNQAMNIYLLGLTAIVGGFTLNFFFLHY